MICFKCKKEIPDDLLRCPHCGIKVNMYCPECNTLNRFGSKYCIECGTELLKVCLNCGSNNLYYSKNCRKCGASLEEHEEVINETPETKPTTAPATPKQAEADVMGIYCSHYTTNNANFAISGWAGGYETLDLSGTKVASWTDFTWECVIDPAHQEEAHDYSAYQKVHVDMWAPAAAKFKFTAEAISGGNYKNGNVVELKKGWNSFDFALAEWPENYDFKNFKCFTLEQYQTPEGESFEHNPFAIANIYFWNAPVVQPTTCAEVYSMAKNDNVDLLNDVVVTYVNGKNVWVKDETASMLIYLSANATWKAGDILSGVAGVVDVYNGVHEIKPTADQAAAVTATAGLAPMAEQVATVTAADVNKYIAFAVEMDEDKSFPEGSQANLTIGGVTFRNQFKNGYSFTLGRKYTIYGVVSIYQSNPQVYFISADDVTTAIDNATVATKAQKKIINGQLFIIRDGVMFNANGAAVK